MTFKNKVIIKNIKAGFSEVCQFAIFVLIPISRLSGLKQKPF